MKFLSDNLLTLILAFVLALSPIQGISASVSKCMNNNMHVQMMEHNNEVTMVAMTGSGDTADSCIQSDCTTTHCASVSFVAVASANFSDVTYSRSRTYITLKLILTSFYSSSLYRPPKA